jgi:hypothetical protein
VAGLGFAIDHGLHRRPLRLDLLELLLSEIASDWSVPFDSVRQLIARGREVMPEVDQYVRIATINSSRAASIFGSEERLLTLLADGTKDAVVAGDQVAARLRLDGLLGWRGSP